MTTRMSLAALAMVAVLGLLPGRSRADDPWQPEQAPAAASANRPAVTGPAGPRPDPGPALIREAYRLGSAATTVAQYSRALQLCHQAQGYYLSANHVQYVRQLAAWLHNRRGEALSEEALQLDDDGAGAEAQALQASALADFDTAAQLDPRAWRPLHNRGLSQALAGQFELAVRDFSRVIERNPLYKNAWFNRAEIHFHQGRFQPAREDYGQVLRLDPNDLPARRQRAQAALRLRQFDEALADYSEIVRLRPDDAQTYLDRADLYAEFERWDEAARDYRVAIRLNPKLARAYQRAAWMMATCPDAGYRNAELALRAAEKALALEPQPTRASLDTLAAAQANAGKFPEARRSIRQALKIAGEEVRGELQARLALYEKLEPYRGSQPSARTASSRP